MLKINRKELLVELEHVARVVDGSKTVPILSHVLLREHAAGLTLAATNLDTSFVSTVAASTDGKFADCCVAARKLLTLVKSLDSDDVELESTDRCFSLRGGGTSFELRTLAADDFPDIPFVEVDGRSVEFPGGLLRRLVGRCLYAISKEENRYQLNGALLEIEPGRARMVATDGHQLAVASLPVDGLDIGEVRCLISTRGLGELALLDVEPGLVRVEIADHRVVFQAGHRRLIDRKLEGTFPNWSRVITRDNPIRIRVESGSLRDATKRCSLMMGERARGVRMDAADGCITIRAMNPDLGNAESAFNVDQVPAFRVGLNPNFLADALDAMGVDQVLVQIKDENSQILIEPANLTAGEESLAVIMPMRL